MWKHTPVANFVGCRVEWIDRGEVSSAQMEERDWLSIAQGENGRPELHIWDNETSSERRMRRRDILVRKAERVNEDAMAARMAEKWRKESRRIVCRPAAAVSGGHIAFLVKIKVL